MPATAIHEGPTFSPFPGRECGISFCIDDGGALRNVRLLFENVEAYKCTYRTFLTREMVDLAYGRLVRLGETPWLAELRKAHRGGHRSELQHLMICFDDGPCYEIVCAGFRVT